jgi:hypothetical protein
MTPGAGDDVRDYDSWGLEQRDQATLDQWRERFPEWAIGYEEWRESDFALGPALPSLSRRDGHPKMFRCPRVFVSYRHCDRPYALRIAWLANQAGFNFWLDVLDSALTALGSSGLTGQAAAVATARIIEMGLLNSSHVVAVMTNNTTGSMWVPYEYGRVKEAPLTSLQASAWLDRGLSYTPEYLELGARHFTESDIRSWMIAQMSLWNHTHGNTCIRGAAGQWHGAAPPPLP